MKLAIRIREGDQIPLGGFKSGSKSRSIATIGIMTQQNEVGNLRTKTLDKGGGLIVRAVVHHQNLTANTKLLQGVSGLGNGLDDDGFFIVSRDNQRQQAILVQRVRLLAPKQPFTPLK